MYWLPVSYVYVLLSQQGLEGKYILPRALPERYAAKEFLIDQSLGNFLFFYFAV